MTSKGRIVTALCCSRGFLTVSELGAVREAVSAGSLGIALYSSYAKNVLHSAVGATTSAVHSTRSPSLFSRYSSTKATGGTSINSSNNSSSSSTSAGGRGGVIDLGQYASADAKRRSEFRAKSMREVSAMREAVDGGKIISWAEGGSGVKPPASPPSPDSVRPTVRMPFGPQSVPRRPGEREGSGRSPSAPASVADALVEGVGKKRAAKLTKVAGSAALTPRQGEYGYVRPASSAPQGVAAGMSLAEIERRMGAIIQGYLSGQLNKERLNEIVGVLWSRYSSGPYPSISAIHDARLIALSELAKHHAAISHYLANPEVAWSVEGLRAVANSAMEQKNVEVHAEVLVRLEELGESIDFQAMRRLLRTCIAAKDMGRIASILPRLANSGNALHRKDYIRMVESALEDSRALKLNTGGFPVDQGFHAVLPSVRGSTQRARFLGVVTERAALSLREVVRSRRAMDGPMHGTSKARFAGTAFTGSVRGSAPPPTASQDGSGSGGFAVSGMGHQYYRGGVPTSIATPQGHHHPPPPSVVSVAWREAELAQDRALAEDTLQYALEQEDMEAATIAYFCARDLQCQDLRRYESQLKRLKTAASMGAAALAEAIVVDMLYGAPLVGQAALKAMQAQPSSSSSTTANDGNGALEGSSAESDPFPLASSGEDGMVGGSGATSGERAGQGQGGEDGQGGNGSAGGSLSSLMGSSSAMDVFDSFFVQGGSFSPGEATPASTHRMAMGAATAESEKEKGARPEDRRPGATQFLAPAHRSRKTFSIVDGKSLIGRPSALSQALNLLAQAYAQCGDVVGVFRTMSILHELRSRWLKVIVHQSLHPDGGFESEEVLGMQRGLMIESIGHPTDPDPVVQQMAVKGRELAEYLACVTDPFMLTEGKSGNSHIGVSSETREQASTALRQAILRMYFWEKTIKQLNERQALAQAQAQEQLEAEQMQQQEEQYAQEAQEGGAGDSEGDAADAYPSEPEPSVPSAASIKALSGQDGQVQGQGGNAARPAVSSVAALEDATGQSTQSPVAEDEGEAPVGDDTPGEPDLDLTGSDPSVARNPVADQLLTQGTAGTAGADASASGSSGRLKVRRPFITQPLLESYGLAATLLGLQPESATPQGYPKPAPPTLPPGSPGWPSDTEPFRRGRTDGLAAIVAGYSVASFSVRLAALGSTEGWALLNGVAPYPIGGPRPVTEEEEEGFTLPVDVATAEAMHDTLFRPDTGLRRGVGCFAMGRDSPWATVMLASVTESARRIFSGAKVNAAGGAAPDSSSSSAPGEEYTDNEGPSSSSSPSSPSTSTSFSQYSVDVASLSLSAHLATIHGGATARLPGGNYDLFRTVRQTLCLSADERSGGAAGVGAGSRGSGVTGGPPGGAQGADGLAGRGRPTLTPVAVNALLNAMAHSYLRGAAPALVRFLTRSMGVQVDADTYAALVAAHAHWRQSEIQPGYSTEIARALRDAGYSPNGAVYGELAYLLARVRGKEEQCVSTLEAAVRSWEALGERVAVARELSTHVRSSVHAACTGQAPPPPLSQQVLDAEVATRGSARGVTGLAPTPLPSQPHFERVVRELLRRAPAVDHKIAAWCGPDWWADQGEEVPVEAPPKVRPGRRGQDTSSTATGEAVPHWRRVLSLMERAGYSPSQALRRTIQEHTGRDIAPPAWGQQQAEHAVKVAQRQSV